jgi:VanZ family protein
MPAILWACVILVLLLLPGDSVPSFRFWTFGLPFDSFVHIVLFFVQMMLAWIALVSNESSPMRLRPLAGAFILTAVYGCATELMQMLVPGRSCDLIDMVADASGAAVFVVLALSGLLRPLLRSVSLPRK